jgi:hypothetical protein
MNFSYDKLLNSYRQLWVNRSLSTDGDSYTTLINAIQVDLKDELTHPRVRISPYQKFHLAVRRILEANLNNDEKLAIIQLYQHEMEKLTPLDNE